MFSLLKRWFGRGEAVRRPRRVRSLVTVESINLVTSDVLRPLKLLDPNLDVFILPDGRVWLLHLEPGRERILNARQSIVLARENEFSGEPMYAERLMLQGFCRWSEDSFRHGTSAGFLEARAQQCAYATDKDVHAEMRRRRAVADGTQDAIDIYNILSQRIRAGAKYDQARVARNAKQFGRHFARR